MTVSLSPFRLTSSDFCQGIQFHLFVSWRFRISDVFPVLPFIFARYLRSVLLPNTDNITCQCNSFNWSISYSDLLFSFS